MIVIIIIILIIKFYIVGNNSMVCDKYNFFFINGRKYNYRIYL